MQDDERANVYADDVKMTFFEVPGHTVFSFRREMQRSKSVCCCRPFLFFRLKDIVCSARTTHHVRCDSNLYSSPQISGWMERLARAHVYGTFTLEESLLYSPFLLVLNGKIHSRFFLPNFHLIKRMEISHSSLERTWDAMRRAIGITKTV